MGKYKVGDKVLVKATISEVNDGTFPNMPYSATVVSKNEWKGVGVEKGKTIEIGEDAIADMTAEEAWEIAKKVFLYPSQGGFNATELEEIFGRTEHLWEMTPQAAKAKIEAWEAAKEIKVGDVVEAEGGIKAVVMDIQRQTFGVFTENGCIEEWYKSKVVKTRHHIDIDGLLKQVRGNKR